MRGALKSPVRYSNEEKIFYICDRMSGKEIAITKWDKIGKGNTSIASSDGTSLTLTYLYIEYNSIWRQILISDEKGISISRINKKEVGNQGPVIWFKHAESNNW